MLSLIFGLMMSGFFLFFFFQFHRVIEDFITNFISCLPMTLIMTDAVCGPGVYHAKK